MLVAACVIAPVGVGVIGGIGGILIALICAVCTVFFLVPALDLVVVAGCLFAVSGPEQFLILRHAPGGEMLGGACVQMAFNLGNALGAFVGGLPISFGCTPRYTALAGIPFCLLGFECSNFFVWIKKTRYNFYNLCHIYCRYLFIGGMVDY